MQVRIPTQLNRCEHSYTAYGHVVPSGIPMKEVVKPSYWRNVAAFLKRFDTIEVVAEDGSYEARMRVMSAVKGGLALRVTHYVDGLAVGSIVQAPDGPSDQLEVNHGGRKDQFRVVDKQTKEVVSKGHGTKEEAERVKQALLDARLSAMPKAA